MRNLILSLALSFSLITLAQAAPCYGTKMPKEREFFSGAQTHVIFKRYLEDDFGKVRSTQYFFLLSAGLYDWLSLDLKVGAGNIKQRPATSDEIDYSSSFSGGYGFRLKWYEKDKSRAVFGFQHISVHPRKTRLGEVKHRAILDDWQASLLVSRDLARITPYLGLKWSRVDYIHKIEETRKRRMSDLTKDLGAVFGIDFVLNEKAWVNLEGQLFDMQACAVSLNFSF
jgi:hypothetical protein